MIKLSAVIITFNEERNIGRCLASLEGVADEVVVVDSYSSDGTEGICRNQGARFIRHAFEGYGQQKNWALQQAAFPYVLALDADEALSPVLRQAILDAKASWTQDGYTMNRLTNYCGQWIRHSGWYPDRKLRLFDTRRGAWSEDVLHEKIEMDDTASTAHLPGDLLHYSYYSVDEHLLRARKYASMSAQAMRARGRRVHWGLIYISPGIKFLRNYVLKRGFLDGRAGWTISRIAALETFWKYHELRRLW